MTDQFELDPERRLWKPNRRSFFFGLGAALIAPMMPSVSKPFVNAKIGWSSAVYVTDLDEIRRRYIEPAALVLASHIDDYAFTKIYVR